MASADTRLAWLIFAAYFTAATVCCDETIVKELQGSSEIVDAKDLAKRQYFDSLGGMALGKRQYFDSLGGMALGKRQYFDSLGGMALGKRQYFDSLGGMALGKRLFYDPSQAKRKGPPFDIFRGSALGGFEKVVSAEKMYLPYTSNACFEARRWLRWGDGAVSTSLGPDH